MRPKLWGMIVFLLSVAVAATPASGSEAYVVSAAANGDAAYMALNPDGSLSGPEDLQLMSESGLSGSGYSYGNGIGDFDGDGNLDYIMAVGKNFNGHVYVFPKTDSGNNFAFPVRVATFSEGYYPTDMAVADFDGDGKLDFVLSYLFSTNCELFLNRSEQEGTFEFEPVLLENTGAYLAIGIDAADFNNDEMPDFIIAPNSDGPLLVNINNGDNSFTTIPFPRPPGANRAYGIAAADFVKDDAGNADLAVSYRGSLDIYTGNGQGAFTLYTSLILPMNNSPLDNGDFNRDGIQDLIVGNFGDNPGSLVVLTGNAEGDFTHLDTDIYTRDSAGWMERKAVTALPYILNKAPVAQLTPEIITVTVGETVEWDASESFDEDGTIVNYEWRYGDGAVSPSGINPLAKSGSSGNSGGPVSSYVYFDTGTYYVTLTVTDDKGATDSIQAEVRVEALPVNVYFSPRSLNLKSKDQWISATLRVPAGYDARMIDPDSLYLVREGKAEIKAHSVYRHRFYARQHKMRYRRIRELTVKFDRQALIKAIDGATGITALNVVGEISSNGTSIEFSGTGTIQAYERKKISFLRKYLMKQVMCFYSKGGSKHSKH